MEILKAQARSRVEPPLHVARKPFGQRKFRCQSLPKNAARLFTRFGLANLVIAKRGESRIIPRDSHGALRTLDFPVFLGSV